MVFFITGSNRDKKRSVIDELIKKHSPSKVLQYDEVSFSVDVADSFIQTGFLDTDTYLVEVDHIFSTDPDIFIPYLQFFHESSHVFVFYEYSLSKELETIFSPYSIHTLPEPKKEIPKANPFILTDYVLDKDKKNAWICLSDLKTKSDTSQIYAALLWAFKTLSIVLSIDNPTEGTTGIKSFVLSKMKQKAKKWSRKEALLGYQILLENQAKEIFDDDALLMRLEQYIFSL